MRDLARVPHILVAFADLYSTKNQKHSEIQSCVTEQGVAAALRRTNVFPLLDQLWAARDADALLRRSVATTVAAMSVPGARHPLPIPL